jgi:hypothetical protein
MYTYGTKCTNYVLLPDRDGISEPFMMEYFSNEAGNE